MSAPDLGRLQPVADDLYTVSAPHRLFGIELGTRMTVARLPGGALWLHSPVPLTPPLQEELDALGRVAHVVCPNLFHHVYAGDYATAYPGAVFHAPRGLARKRKDLCIHRELSETPDEEWGGALAPLSVHGTMLRETFFLHRASRTLVTSDLIENFEAPPGHLPTRIYLRLAGLRGRPGWSRFLRFLYRDRAKAREDIERLLDLDFDRIIVAHGSSLDAGAKPAIQSALRWLLP